MKKVLAMLSILTAIVFAFPSFSYAADTTVFYMPITTDVTTKNCDGVACGTIELDDSNGILGVTYGMLSVDKLKTDGEFGNRSHYGVGAIFDYELTDGMTVFAGASLYSGFENDEHRVDMLDGQVTGMVKFGVEAPIYKNVGLRIQIIPNIISAAGLYAKF